MDNPIKTPVKVEQEGQAGIANYGGRDLYVVRSADGRTLCKDLFEEEANYIAHCINQHKKYEDIIKTFIGIIKHPYMSQYKPYSKLQDRIILARDKAKKTMNEAEQLLAEEKNASS